MIPAIDKQSGSIIVPESQKTFDGLRAKPDELKEQACSELVEYYLKFSDNNELINQLFAKLQKLINSNDSSEKLGGMLAVEYLTSVIQETQQIGFVNKFLSVIFQQFIFNTDLKIIQRAAEVFGKLVKMGGTQIAQVIVSDVEEAMKWIKGDNVREIKKFASLLVLKVLLEEVPYLSFNKIFHDKSCFQSIWQLIREKKSTLRDAALKFLDVCICQISQREDTLQREWTMDIVKEIQKSQHSTDFDVVHGNINVLKSLLAYTRKDLLIDNLVEMSDYILNHRNDRSNIQLTVIETIPVILRFNPGVFVIKDMTTVVGFLLDVGKGAKEPKLKTVSYSTLAKIILEPIDSTCLEPFLPDILKTMLAELQRKNKPFCPEVVKCLDNLRYRFKRKMVQMIDVGQFVDSLLMNGLYSCSLDFMNQLCKLEVDHESEFIQFKILNVISYTLSGKIYIFPFKSQIDSQRVTKFQTNLIQEMSSNSEYRSPESISLSLQALASFDFDRFADSMALFVKDVVLEYLDSENSDVRKAAAKAGCLLYIRNNSLISGQYTITKNLVSDILQKFLCVCLSDPDNEVREIMLLSLNENFDVFLNSEDTLRQLFMCLNDPIYAVKENSLKILCRLGRRNPSEIIPYFQKKILQLLNDLKSETLFKEKERIQQIQLLNCFIDHAESLVMPHTDTICLTLLKILNDRTCSGALMTPLLQVIGSVAHKSQRKFTPYIHEFFPMIVQGMQDMSSTAKREISIKTMIKIIKSAGYVILPYLKYPFLPDVILQLLRIEANPSIRQEILRLIGALGALDSFQYKKLQYITEDEQNHAEDLMEDLFKAKFTIALEPLSSGKYINQPLLKLYNFFDDIVVLYGLDRRKIGAEINKASVINTHQLSGRYRFHQRSLTSSNQTDELEIMLTTPEQINLGKIDYYTTVTIKAVLKVLIDQTLQQYHELALEALIYILGVLRVRSTTFLHLVMPVLTYQIAVCDANLRESLLHRIEKIVKLCGSSFQDEYVETVLQIILQYIPDQKLSIKSFELLNTLVNNCKKKLAHKMEIITTKLNQLLIQYENHMPIIIWVLKVYNNLGDMVNFYLENIITTVTQYQQHNPLFLEREVVTHVIAFFQNCIENCPNCIQSASKIVTALLFLLDNYQTNQNVVINLFIRMLQLYKDTFIVYLPIIHLKISKLKVQSNRYKVCVNLLLNSGNLDEVDQIAADGNEKGSFDRESMVLSSSFMNSINSNSVRASFLKTTTMDPNATSTHAFSIRPNIDYDVLLKEFDTSNKILKEDWIEWYRKSSVELLKQSPYPVLWGCHSFAELFNPIARELYNVAFVSCWSMLNDKQKETMIGVLISAISSPNIPINILQTFLNLAEFMYHDREVIPIDIRILADLAERCQAYAKALYYRELEFENSPDSAIESLISLYSNLGQSEAANGLLIYVKKNLDMELKESWYENLQRWEEALEAYRNKQLDDPTGEDYFVNKMRCFYHLSDWDVLLKHCDNLLDSNRQEDFEKRKQVAHMAADAALHLNEWDKFERYIEKIEDTNENKTLLNAVLSLKKNKLDEAASLVNKAREALDTKVSGLLLESYSRAYDNVLKLQTMVEMEEIIDYKRIEKEIIAENDNLIGHKAIRDDTRNGEVTGTDDEKIYAGLNIKLTDHKKNLLNKWNDRLNGCQPTVDVWQRLLAVRSVLLDKSENIDALIKFAQMCRKSKQNHMIKICQRTLESIKTNLKSLYEDLELPPKLILASLECDFLTGATTLAETIERISGYLENNPPRADDKREQISGLKRGKILIQMTQAEEEVLRSKYFCKLGKLAHLLHEDNPYEAIRKELTFYKRAIECNPQNYKAYHALGYVHFEAVEYLENKKEQRSDIIVHTIAALKGFIESISKCGGSSASSRTLQDLLRMVTLWFKYGDDEQVELVLQESFNRIDIISWIEVVPQIMARLDNPHQRIQSLIQTLLMKIGANHAQSIIYPLTVSLHDDNSIRRAAGQKILDHMKQHSNGLIQQAVLVAEELNRAAILMKEHWIDGVEEACRYYFQEKNLDQMLKTFMELTNISRKDPETLNEITFHQSFRWEIAEADSWLMRYAKTKEIHCINQAWDTYHTLFRRISEKAANITKIYLENVSPKLLHFKNGDISVPGLYRPDKPVIKIESFAPKMTVLTSKQHPRKLEIYGSDGKEYTFLLKGKEDTRQDERVMQLFSLVNKLLASEPETSKRGLSITRYSVIPLSQKAGLIGWVQNCDTLQQLIKEYRESARVFPTTEQRLYSQMCQNFEVIPMANKIEIFRYVLENTKGEDLKKVFWLKSPNSETWLERRTTFTKSLATMSMVGYILGLGDRHPSNIMLQRQTGQIVHIDFGDCFEVAMKRDKFPERVPFRLTRMLVKSMEVSSIEGTFRNTCESVMTVLRQHKESLMAILQAFVYDPLVNWRLLTASDAGAGAKEAISPAEGKPPNRSTRKKTTQKRDRKEGGSGTGKELLGGNEENGGNNGSIEEEKEKMQNFEKIDDERIEVKTRLNELKKELIQGGAGVPDQILNQRALEVVDRIKKKLVGRDFKEHEALDVVDQVNQLIRQATSHENISQAYIGWCPFW